MGRAHGQLTATMNSGELKKPLLEYSVLYVPASRDKSQTLTSSS